MPHDWFADDHDVMHLELRDGGDNFVGELRIDGDVASIVLDPFDADDEVGAVRGARDVLRAALEALKDR